MLAVVMHHAEIERVDALEIFGVEHVLGADAVDGFRAEIRLEQPQNWPQHRHAGQSKLAALLLKPLDQVFFQQRVEDQAGGFGDFGEHMIELLLRAHHRIKMLDRRNIRVLRRSRTRDGNQRFAGRVRHEMQMEIAGVRHLYKDRASCELHGRRPRLYGPCKRRGPNRSISVHMTAAGTRVVRNSYRCIGMWTALWG